MVTAARQEYMKQYYLDHKGEMDDNHRVYMAANPGLHKKPKPEQTLTMTRCIGPRCWPKGLTFMSPDPSRVRRCDECIAYTKGRNP